MRKIRNTEGPLPGPACETAKQAETWLVSSSEIPFIPGAFPGMNIMDGDLPGGTIPVGQIVLVLPESRYGGCTIAHGGMIYPLTDIIGEFIIAGPIETADDLDEMLDILAYLEEDVAPTFAAAIAESLTEETAAALRALPDDCGNALPIAQVLAMLDAPPAKPTFNEPDDPAIAG